jgi:hypothetical protein
MLTEKEIQVSLAEWQMWLKHPTTIAVMEFLEAERSAQVQKLAFGGTLQRPGLEIKETAETVGIIAGLGALLNDFEVELLLQIEEAQARREEKEKEEAD